MNRADLRAATRDLLVEYLSANNEASARRMAQDLQLEKSEVNSVLYGNPSRFHAVGDHPPLWSLKGVDSSRESEVQSISSPQDQVFWAQPATTDGNGVSNTTKVPLSDARPGKASSARISERRTSFAPAKSFSARARSEIGQSSATAKESQSEDRSKEVEQLVTEFPGLTVDEIGAVLGISRAEVENGVRRVRYLVLVDEEHDRGWSEAESSMLTSLAKAGTMAFPLSSDDYDDLVRRGFVSGRSAVRITQVFGSWRRACELAEVEAPSPVREHYERKWSQRELAETVARYLSDPEYRGVHHRYDEWRERSMKVDEIPSSGTLKNYLGRSWRTVQNRGLEVLREKWLLEGEMDLDD